MEQLLLLIFLPLVGAIITAFAGNGTNGYFGDGGPIALRILLDLQSWL